MRNLSLSNGITIIILCTLVFGISFVFTNYSESKELDEICDAKAQQDMDYMLAYIDKELSQAEQAAKTFAAAVFENGHIVPSPDEIYRQEELFLAANPNLSSVQVGFEDRVFPQYSDSNGFGPLVVSMPDGMKRLQLNTVPDFRKFDWYNIAIHKGERRWCKPFLSPTGRYPITTYSLPLYNNNNHLVGVVGVSMRISRFDSILTRLKPYPNAVPAVLLNNDLTYILHPIKDFVLNMSLKSELEAVGETASDEFLTRLGARQEGKEKVQWEGRSRTIYYAPVEKAECTAMMGFDDETTRQAIMPDQYKRMGTGIIGFIILTLYLVFLMSTNRRRRHAKRQHNKI